MFCVRTVFNCGARIHFTRPRTLSHTCSPQPTTSGAPKSLHSYIEREQSPRAVYMCTTARRCLMGQCEDLFQPKHMCGSHRYAHCSVGQHKCYTYVRRPSRVRCSSVVVRIHAQAHDIFLRSHYEILLRLHWRRPTIATDASCLFFSFSFSLLHFILFFYFGIVDTMRWQIFMLFSTWGMRTRQMDRTRERVRRRSLVVAVPIHCLLILMQMQTIYMEVM